jgi:hypothetical protein
MRLTDHLHSVLSERQDHGGQHCADAGPSRKLTAFEVEQAGEYLLIALHKAPPTEAGVYRFALALGSQEVVLDIPVTRVSPGAHLGVH